MATKQIRHLRSRTRKRPQWEIDFRFEARVAGWLARDMCTQREEGGPFLPQVSDFKEYSPFTRHLLLFGRPTFAQQSAKLSAVVGLAINLSCRQSKLIYRL